MAISTLLVNGSLDSVMNVAQELGLLRREVNLVEFQTILINLGMNGDEALSYWDAIDMVSVGFDCCSRDVQLSSQCGILLDSTKLPKNMLLYRIVQLMFPALFSVSIKTVDHKGVVSPGRWEYAGEGKRNVLVLRFPSEEADRPKKQRVRRRRSRWRDERHSMLDRW